MLGVTRRFFGAKVPEIARFQDGHKYSGAKYYIKYSRHGPFSTYSLRQRWATVVRNIPDSALADFSFNKFVGNWIGEFASYNFYFMGTVSWIISWMFVLRHAMFNPDITCRHNEKRLPLPDRLRQWSYALPYYNNRIKNWSAKFKWMLIQNEPDWNDINWLGARPNREQCHRRCMVWNVFHWFVPLYRMEDPMYESCTNYNFCKIYHEMGYKKCPEFFDDAEE